jgi:hypothetical protein
MSGEEDVNEESATDCTCKLSSLTEGYDPKALLTEMKLDLVQRSPPPQSGKRVCIEGKSRRCKNL